MANKTLEIAKIVCENACNTNIGCFYAILNYVEGKTEDCSLVKEDNDGEACGDWINNENQLNRYFYKKGITKKFVVEKDVFNTAILEILHMI